MLFRMIWVLGLAALGGACGGQPSRKPISSNAQAGAALMAGLQALQKKVSHGDALVTIALFGGAELADEKGLEADIRPVIGAILGRSKRRHNARDRPRVISAPIDEKLPLDVNAVAVAAGAHRPAIAQASRVVFIRYAGKPLPEAKHLRATLQAALRLATSRSHILVDLSTRRTYDAAAYARWVETDDRLTDQVVPGIEKTTDGRVTLFSRGMAKFGLPDLEWYGLDETAARTRFGQFQEALARLRGRRQVRVGDALQGVTLIPCKRPAHAIEAECVGLP